MSMVLFFIILFFFAAFFITNVQILITHTSHSTDQHILRQFCLFFLCPFPPLFSFPSLLCFSHLPFFNFHLPLLSSASHPVFPSFSLPLLSLSLSGVFTLLLFFYSYTFSAVTLSLIENALLQSFNIPAGNTHTHIHPHRPWSWTAPWFFHPGVYLGTERILTRFISLWSFFSCWREQLTEYKYKYMDYMYTHGGGL